MNPMSCHPARSLATSEANPPTQSKDACCSTAIGGAEGGFHIVIRFFDEHEAERLPEFSGEAAACNSPGRKCRVGSVHWANPVGTAPYRPANEE
ncbi:MAG TPA: hypothetical protein VGS05_02140 [Candidatus Sulfotelmatobacter sp.]|nr:hypothetical protein [Candidatus Sulfotelmatobacter sp.]